MGWTACWHYGAGDGQIGAPCRGMYSAESHGLARSRHSCLFLDASKLTRVDIAQTGATPLFMAAQEGHEGCARLLLEAKAAVDAARNVSGRSAATLTEWRAWEG